MCNVFYLLGACFRTGYSKLVPLFRMSINKAVKFFVGTLFFRKFVAGKINGNAIITT